MSEPSVVVVQLCAEDRERIDRLRADLAVARAQARMEARTAQVLSGVSQQAMQPIPTSHLRPPMPDEGFRQERPKPDVSGSVTEASPLEPL